LEVFEHIFLRVAAFDEPDAVAQGRLGMAIGFTHRDGKETPAFRTSDVKNSGGSDGAEVTQRQGQAAMKNRARTAQSKTAAA
jgi:hypothetical protein